MTDGWLWKSAGDLGREIESCAMDPRALTEVYLASIDAHADAGRIYARVTADRARAEAAGAAERARAGLRRGPLDGVPISWKDLFDTAGVATEAGSALLSGRTPEHDCEVLASARRAGLVCLGKTHMTELAFSGLGVNPVTATPPNANDPALAPGGSSSGAATSVAFGLAAAAIGSDTGGSVRVPAAWNDLVGLKTSHGSLPMRGVVPLCPRFDTIGPLCRTVEDAALLLAALSGEPGPDLAGTSLRGTRLLALEMPGGAVPGGEAPAAAFDDALARLAAAGAAIERQTIPAVEEALSLAHMLFAPEAYGVWRERIEADPEAMFPPVRERFRAGGAVSAADYVRAWRRLEALRRDDAEATVPILPPNVEAVLADHDHFAARNLLALRNTRVGNLFGLCALTLPSGTPACGLMAMAGPGREKALLRLGAPMERALA